MSWFVQTFSSSIGKKVTMSLTGLFLCTFLVIHLIGNLALLKHDGGQSFNLYANFMAHNPLIETVSWGLYFFILLHSVVAFSLFFANKKARPVQYATVNNKSTWESRQMTLLGTFILVFIIVHMIDFMFKYKFSGDASWTYGYKTYTGHEGSVRDLYALVTLEFKETLHMVLYVIAQLVLMFHLKHGFQSAFQTLGLNHVKYTPAIKGFGLAFSIIVPLGFMIQPLYVYFCV
jgi:succinate dehydrogenase / fumarate reductase, cytochrome b subunit